MSEEAKVETPEKADDVDPEALFREFGEKEAGLGDGPLADDKPDAKEEPKESQEEAPAKEPPAPAEKADDPWKDAPPALREAHEQALEAERTRAAAAETLARRHSGRLSQAHHELNDLRAKLTPKADGTATPEGDEAKDREERRKQLLEEYGDSAGKLIPDIIAAEERIARLESAVTSQADAQTEDMLQQQLGVLEQAHPDWHTVTRDPTNPARPNPAFVAWAKGQPGYIQDCIVRNSENNQIVDGASAADILSLFKRDTAPPEDPEKAKIAARRAAQMEAGLDTKTRAPAATKTGAADSDTQGLWNEFDARDRRAAAGRGG